MTDVAAKEKIAIVGSRGYKDEEAVADYINSLPDNVTIVTGGAVGVDTFAETAAHARGLEVIVIKPNYEMWTELGNPKYAPIARNKQIVAIADRIVAFWDGKSRGTASVIRFAEEMGKDYDITVEGNEGLENLVDMLITTNKRRLAIEEKESLAEKDTNQ